MDLPDGISCAHGRKPFREAMWVIEYERAQEVWQVYSQCALKKEAIALAKQLKKNGFAPKLRIKCGGGELHA